MSRDAQTGYNVLNRVNYAGGGNGSIISSSLLIRNSARDASMSLRTSRIFASAMSSAMRNGSGLVSPWRRAGMWFCFVLLRRGVAGGRALEGKCGESWE